MVASRICILAPDLIPVWSGIATYTIGLLNYLPRDLELHVITTRRELPGVNTDEELHSLMRELQQNVKIYPVCSSTKTLLDHAKFQVTCLKVFPELHRKFNFDLLHVNFPLMSEILLTITKQVDIPVLSTLHTTIEGQHHGVQVGRKEISKMSQTDFANLFLNLPLKLAETICLARYSKIIATSRFIKNELETYFPFVSAKNVAVVHNGVDTTFFHPINTVGTGALANLRATDRPIVLFTGRFVATKGIYTLIHAIPRIVEEHPDVLFVFAGGGDYSHYFQPMNDQIRNENCCFLGYLPRDDMPKLYSLANIYVMPTLYESFPLRLLESMACENTVVATEICGIPEVIQSGENGFLIPPSDRFSLAKTVNTLLGDSNRLREIGKRARSTVLKKFSAKGMAHKTAKIYNEVLTE